MTGRPSPAIEAIVYFSAAELLANAAKHSGAGTCHDRPAPTAVRKGMMLTVTDDGGGRRPRHRWRGAGWAGRTPAGSQSGRYRGIDSPAAATTSITVELPGHA